jgi:hypothetical protein
LAGCGPADVTKEERATGERNAEAFMKDFGRCDDCGKRRIDLFPGAE